MLERVGAVGDVVGGVGVAFGAGEDHRRRLRKVARPFGRRHDHRGRAVGLEAAVEAGGTARDTHGDAR